MAEAAGADDHGRRTGDQLRQRSLDRVVRVRPAVGQRGGGDRVQAIERYEVARVVDEQVLGDGARPAEPRWPDAQGVRPQAVILLALRALGAGAATPGPVHRDRVALAYTADARTQRGDRADTLVAEGERKLVGEVLGGPAHHRDVGVADAAWR